MNETKTVCATVIAAIFLLIGGCTADSMFRDQKMADAIKAGADPIAVACAYRSNGSEPLCMGVTK